jgi:hypothetical protein
VAARCWIKVVLFPRVIIFVELYKFINCHAVRELFNWESWSHFERAGYLCCWPLMLVSLWLLTNHIN